jgi:cold shock CspA family protein/ribosome-associated translation inhibitor RaiA
LVERIREKALELEQFYPRLIGIDVTVERPGRHHRQGKGAHYRIRIEASVPGELLVVSRDPEPHQANEDPYLAVQEAFHTMRRQLQDYGRRQRGEVKPTEGASHGWVRRLFPEGYGFIEAADGREIFFHRNSVLNDGFDRLEPGDEVRFAEELGEEGPQASTVEQVGATGYHAIEPAAPM